MTRDRVVVVLRVARQGVGDPVGQQLAVGQAGGRVVQGAALGAVDQPRVVEGDRGQLGEAGQGARSRARRTAARPSPEARPMTPTTRPPEVSGTPTTDPNVPVGTSPARPVHAS